jgi:peroxidase
MEGLWLVVLVIFVMALSVQSQLKTGFYSTSCSKAEAIVRSTVESYFKKDPTIAAGLLRLHFHDCFVQVYIYSPPPLACLYNCQ